MQSGLTFTQAILNSLSTSSTFTRALTTRCGFRRLVGATTLRPICLPRWSGDPLGSHRLASTGRIIRRRAVPRAHAANFALLGPMDRTLAQLTYTGKVKAFIDPAGGADQEKLFS